MAALKNVDLPAEGFPKEEKHWQTDHITKVTKKTHTPPQGMLIYASKAKLNSTHPIPSLIASLISAHLIPSHSISSHPISSHPIPSLSIPSLTSSHLISSHLIALITLKEKGED